jgi:serine phosphatase RsbU (regulator of sigma subunit)
VPGAPRATKPAAIPRQTSMRKQRFRLPAFSDSPRPGLVERLRRYVLGTWRGRVLALAVLVQAALWAGVPVPFGELAAGLLLLFAVVYSFVFLQFLARRLVWRIRTKLILSYLFVAFVPVFLLSLFFVIAGVLVLALGSSFLVARELEWKADVLGSATRTALAAVDARTGSQSPQFGQLLDLALSVHPKSAFRLVVAGRTVASRGQAPSELPAWWKGPGFAGLVRDAAEGPEVLRAVGQEQGAFLVVDAPLDAMLLSDTEQRLGIRFLAAARHAQRGRGDRGPRVTARVETEGGLNSAAFSPIVDWKSGLRETHAIPFRFQPRDLVQRLSPESFDAGDVLVKVLAVVGVTFLVMYAFALLVGLLLARSITQSVHALTEGTRRLRAGNFGDLIQVRSRDQLGELAESFNMMTVGIQDLLREQAEKERLEEELRIARHIQMSLLPPQGQVTPPGIRIAALCLPATEVGGDYYDLIPISEGRMGVLVADVSGKGTSAALYMAELKGLVLSLASIYESPAKLLGEANRILATNLDARSFITMTYAVVDTDARTMRYARAGHNPIIHFEVATGRTHVLAPSGLGLGLDRGDRFEQVLEEALIPLRSGDVFLFFTDGLSEAMNAGSELFGERRLRQIVELSETLGSEELKERILAEIRSFVGDTVQQDDMTLVVLKVV